MNIEYVVVSSLSFFFKINLSSPLNLMIFMRDGYNCACVEVRTLRLREVVLFAQGSQEVIALGMEPRCV